MAESFSCGGVSGHADGTEEGIAGALHALGGVEVGGGGRARKAGAAGVVDHRHSAARRCGSSRWRCLNWVCRDDLFLRDAYRRAFDALLEALGGRKALPPVGLLAPGP